ncbi:MAG: sigma-54-dependent Fis family transcriptional regulator [Candidatus Eisenbacteria bacterium]|uniref:Sigma-54-dependent Fis family transcriptional regulator n=1 Tax=Eiseniibacteriota bacterium TaxID=2212470 RepID=A0A9D6L3J5_UNCEI|nr:sigma-54-dependent Fis family transcriptional regulator [Candidatus Eisenbacteria bacterium]MBI3539127.1 sigma-54-dependent Fis family transcriptional regulator [Candidatus Eisenbacteria bacterium]
MPSLLIVDDEPNIRASLEGALGREGYAVESAASPAEARTRLREAFDVVLLDIRFPGASGMDLLAEIAAAAPETVVIMMSGHATLEDAVRATRLGAFDVLEKPVALERLLVLLRNATAARALRAENRRLRPAAAALVGRSPAVARLLREIALAGPSGSRVLIRGEHGTGKELVARALHATSPRREMPFVAVNCSAIPDELFESELFGHERGAFTGATQARRGRFEEASGGTLFLDEVGDLTPRAQTKLLRVLQEGELQRVGGSRAIRVDARVIAATNRDLERVIADGGFREDLYFRLAVIPIVVPPLRERSDDVPLLVDHFAAEIAAGAPPRAFRPEAKDVLRAHPFPGNVRELRNLVERLVIMNPGVAIGAAEVRAVLPDITVTPERGDPARLADAVRAFERRQIEAALAAEGNNMTRAAARLGLERSHLYKKMKQLGCAAPADGG